MCLSARQLHLGQSREGKDTVGNITGPEGIQNLQSKESLAFLRTAGLLDMMPLERLEFLGGASD